MNPQMEPWPQRFDERLHIFAYGETFDADAFLTTSTLHPDYVWRRERPMTSGIERQADDLGIVPTYYITIDGR
jgi:hypothetical protein